MQTVLLIVHLIVVLALIGVVLLQRSEGGLGLGGGGGVSGFMTGRGQANALTRATAILAALFFATSMALTLMASYGRAPRSILDTVVPPPVPGQSQPAGGGGPNLLEQLQRQQGDQPSTPASPAPAPSAPSIPFAPPAGGGAAPQVPPQ